MKKKLTYIIICVAIITAIVSMVTISIKQRNQQIFEEAHQKFEENVLPEYLNDMREIGFEDLEITVDYVEYPWDEWSEQVEVTEYHTEEIDSLYTEKYESDNAKEITSILLAMRGVRNRYCNRYVYEIQGKEITIVFKDNYTEFFTVHSEDYMYQIYSYNGKHSMSINGNPLYYSGSASTSSETKKHKTTTNKYQYATPSSSNKDDLYDDYDVYEYYDPEDFYYDWEDDFDGYEEAEDYWYEAWDEVER